VPPACPKRRRTAVNGGAQRTNRTGNEGRSKTGVELHEQETSNQWARLGSNQRPPLVSSVHPVRRRPHTSVTCRNSPSSVGRSRARARRLLSALLHSNCRWLPGQRPLEGVGGQVPCPLRAVRLGSPRRWRHRRRLTRPSTRRRWRDGRRGGTLQDRACRARARHSPAGASRCSPAAAPGTPGA
jgi:hypothetical protein